MEENIKLITIIKSQYILKLAFSFLQKRKNLNMIIHNRELQKRIGITIDDYKKESGRCKTIRSNGFGKEIQLETNKILFIGEYKNGKRNGIGIEYDEERRIIYKGNYLNGKRNGKGKEYDRSSGIIYEGEYLNGKKNGRVKEYNEIIKFDMFLYYF